MRIDTITPAQQARFKEWTEKWVQIGLSTEPADFDAATEAALKAYKLCNLEKPMVILRMGSPYGATLGGAIAWTMLREMGGNVESQVGSQVESQVWSQVGSQVGSQVESQVRSQVGSQVWSQVGSQVWSQVGSQVWSQVGSQVESQVRSQVESQVRSQVGSQVWSQVGSQVESQVGSQVWSQVWSQVESQVRSQVGSQVRSGLNNDRGGSLYYSGWCAYISFLRDVMGWEDPVLERFSIDEVLAENCGWVWWHENVLAISDRPEVLKRDEQGRLHCEDGPSIAYRDGWALHHWHGVPVPAEWIMEKKITPKEALQWPNIEQRRAAVEIVGWGNVLKELKVKVIDKDDDPEIGELIEVNIPDSGKERFLRVRCGTGREGITIPVPREMKTAHEAGAWTYGLDTLSYLPEVRT